MTATINITEGTAVRSMLRAVEADLIRWRPVGPFGSMGFTRATGQRYLRAHLKTLIVLWQAQFAGLIVCDPDTGGVWLTEAGRATLVVQR